MKNTIEVLTSREESLIKVDRKSFIIGRPEEVKLKINERQLFIRYKESEIPKYVQEQLLKFSETIGAVSPRDNREFPYYKGKTFDIYIQRKYNTIIKNKSLNKL